MESANVRLYPHLCNNQVISHPLTLQTLRGLHTLDSHLVSLGLSWGQLTISPTETTQSPTLRELKGGSGYWLSLTFSSGSYICLPQKAGNVCDNKSVETLQSQTIPWNAGSLGFSTMLMRSRSWVWLASSVSWHRLQPPALWLPVQVDAPLVTRRMTGGGWAEKHQ